MARGRQKAEWERAAEIVAMIHNTTRARQEDCKPAGAFNPLHQPTRPQRREKVPLRAYKGSFVAD